MRWLAKLFERFDWTLLTACLTLTSVGLVTIYGIAISQEPADLFLFQKQCIATLLGVTVALVLMIVDFRHLRSFGLLLFVFGGLLLVSVLLFGESIRGTQGWFRIAGLSFQPVEIAKITLTIYLAALYVRYEHGGSSWRTFGMGALATGIYVGLVMMQPDFGSAMVLLGTWLLLTLFAGWPRRAWIIIPLVSLVAAAGIWSFGLKPYQRDRIMTFLNQEQDLRGSGYNARQALIAIGSGGLVGKGVSEGTQARLRFLPEASTDFLFAVIGEELGLIGICVVLGLFLLVLYRYIRIAQDSEDDFAVLVLIGLGATMLIHVFENAGMNLGVMPITGIPMPFLSAAASSLVVTFMGLGLAESIAIRRRSGET